MIYIRYTLSIDRSHMYHHAGREDVPITDSKNELNCSDCMIAKVLASIFALDLMSDTRHEDTKTEKT